MFILCMGMGAAIYHLVKIDVTIQTIVDCQVKLTHWGCGRFLESMYIPFQVNHLHGQTEPVPRRMRATLTETEPVLFDANYQATAC